VASCLYGTAALGRILPGVASLGAGIELWPRPWGGQREEARVMGSDRNHAVFRAAGVPVTSLAAQDLVAYKAGRVFDLAAELDCPVVVTAVPVRSGPRGARLRAEVRSLVGSLGGVLEQARRAGIALALQNEAGSLLDSGEALQHLAEVAPLDVLGVALAPQQLEPDAERIAGLIDRLGPSLFHVYASQAEPSGAFDLETLWPELQQLPGRGPLDFGPILAALARQEYAGAVTLLVLPSRTEEAPVRPPEEVTGHVSEARRYLERCRAPASAPDGPAG
jgi:sugar phosphate isomerase/epimerase